MENKRIEESYVGSLMIDPFAVKAYPVKPEDIRDTQLRGWYVNIIDLVEAGGHPDILTVGDGDARLMNIMMDTPSALHIETYANKIKLAAFRRRMETAGTAIVNLARNSDDPRSEIELVRVHMGEDTFTEQGTSPIQDWASRAWDRYETGESGVVLSCGMSKVDRVVGMFRVGVTLIGGIPGAGKSMLLQRIMRGFCEKKHAGVFYSLEMSEEQFMDRVMSAESGVLQSRLSSGTLNEAEWAAMPRALETIERWPMQVTDGAWTTDQIRADLIRMKTEKGITWFAVDYLERLRDKTPGMKGWERTEVIARRLINIAKDLDLVCVAIQKLIKSGWEGIATMDEFAGGSDLAYDAISMVVLTEHTPKTGESLPNMRTLVNVKPNRLTEQYERYGHLVKSDSLPIILPEEKFGG